MGHRRALVASVVIAWIGAARALALHPHGFSLSYADALTHFPSGIISDQSTERLRVLARRFPTPPSADLVHILVEKKVGAMSQADELVDLSVKLPAESSQALLPWFELATGLARRDDALIDSGRGWKRIAELLLEIARTNTTSTNLPRPASPPSPPSWWLEFDDAQQSAETAALRPLPLPGVFETTPFTEGGGRHRTHTSSHLYR